MTIVTPGPRPLLFLLTEANGQRSRANKTIPSGAGIIVSGQVCATVTATGAVVPLAPAASDGSQNANCISMYKYNATSAAVMGAFIDNDAEVKEEELVWPVGISGPQKLAAVASLRAAGIKILAASYV